MEQNLYPFKGGVTKSVCRKIEFDSGVFHNLASKVYELYFSHLSLSEMLPV